MSSSTNGESLHTAVSDAIERGASNPSLTISLLNRLITRCVPAELDLDNAMAIDASLCTSTAFMDDLRAEIMQHENETELLIEQAQITQETMQNASLELERVERCMRRVLLAPGQANDFRLSSSMGFDSSTKNGAKRRSRLGSQQNSDVKQFDTSSFRRPSQTTNTMIVSNIPLKQKKTAPSPSVAAAPVVPSTPSTFRMSVAPTPRAASSSVKDNTSLDDSATTEGAQIAVKHKLPGTLDLAFDHQFIAHHAANTQDSVGTKNKKNTNISAETLDQVLKAFKSAMPGERSNNNIQVIAKHLQRFGALSSAPRDKLRRLANLSSIAKFEPGSRIVQQGTRVSAVYAMVSGGGVYVVREDEFRRNVAVRGIGTLFADQTAVDECCSPVSIVVRQRQLVVIVMPARAYVACLLVPQSTLRDVAPYWSSNVTERYQIVTAHDISNSVDNGKHDIPQPSPIPSAKERISLACDFISDAIADRDLHRRLPGKLSTFILHTQRSRAYRALIMLLLLSLLIVAVFESANRERQTDTKVRLVESAIVVLLCVDSLLRAFLVEGIRQWFQFKVNRARCFVLVVMLIDIIMSVIIKNGALRVSRVLRPVLLVLQYRVLRRHYTLAIRSARQVLPAFTLLAGIFVVFAVVGRHLFYYNEDIYNQTLMEQGDGIFANNCSGSVCEGITDNFVFNSFSTWSYAFLTLFMLLTTETYPHLTWPAYAASPIYTLYYTAFALLAIFFLLNVVLAAIYNAYQAEQTAKLINEKHRQRKALHAAFLTIDVFGCGSVSMAMFDLLVNRLQPKVKKYQVLALYELLDADGDGELSPIEFFHICDALLLNVSHEEVHFNKGVSVAQLYSQYGVRIALRALIQSVSYKVLRSIIVILNTFVLLLLAESRTILGFVDFVLCGVFVVDIVVSAYAVGVRHYLTRSPDNKLDILATTMQLIGGLVDVTNVVSANDSLHQLSVLRFAGLLRMLHVMNAVLENRNAIVDRILCQRHKNDKPEMFHESSKESSESQSVSQRSFPETPKAQNSETETSSSTLVHANEFQRIVSTFVDMIPPFVFMCFALVFTLMYSYAIVGMEIYAPNNSECSVADFMNYEPSGRFCSLATSYLALFQMLLATNWHPMLFNALESNTSQIVSVVFFTSFFTIGVFFVLNLFTAVFIDIFVERMDIYDEALQMAKISNHDGTNTSNDKLDMQEFNRMWGSSGQDKSKQSSARRNIVVGTRGLGRLNQAVLDDVQ